MATTESSASTLCRSNITITEQKRNWAFLKDLWIWIVGQDSGCVLYFYILVVTIFSNSHHIYIYIYGEISYAITYIGASVQSNDLVHLI
jgi:hypothetical protein